jgi:hypothetical protein
MVNTTHLGVTLIEQSQSQKEMTINTALTRIDALMNTGAKSRTTNTPPGSPLSGDLYIVGSSPTGAWSGQALKLVYFDQVWKFITPNTGVTLYVNDEGLVYSYNGTSWVVSGSGESNTASNLGSGTGVYGAKVGMDLRFKSLIAGTNVTLSNTANDIIINASGGGGSGTVTSASVVSANGFSGTVATATTTPAITVSTSVTGLLKGNGTAISAATAGADFLSALTGDVTSSGNATTIANNAVTTAKINASAVTNAKLATSTANTLAGYDSGGVHNTVTLGGGLALAAGVLAATPSVVMLGPVSFNYRSTTAVKIGTTPAGKLFIPLCLSFDVEAAASPTGIASATMGCGVTAANYNDTAFFFLDATLNAAGLFYNKFLPASATAQAYYAANTDVYAKMGTAVSGGTMTGKVAIIGLQF